MTQPGVDAKRLVEEYLALVEADDFAAVGVLLEALHPGDIADFLERVQETEDLAQIIRLLPSELASETLSEMEEGELRTDLLEAFRPEETAEFLDTLADDDAADLISEYRPDEQALILAALPADRADELSGLLLYGEETAGGLMTTALVKVGAELTAAQAIDTVREQGREVDEFYNVFVVDAEDRLLGTVPLDDLILASPDRPVAELVQTVIASVLPDTDQEDVGRLFTRYNTVSLPVLDAAGVLLGRITFDDVIDVIEAEQTEDLLLLAGVSDEEELRGGWAGAVRSRLPWLSANLLTAAVAATVVWVYTDTIVDLPFLAVLMPIVAGMGGNAGTQALAVTVRRLAVSGAPMEGRARVVGKELIVGFVNGLVIGVIVALFTGLTMGWPAAGVVLIAMWGNILVAGFAGAFVPSVLDRFGIDPAVASSVFVTTFTDLFGFLLLLGLATELLL
jgi:magnesium transporter